MKEHERIDDLEINNLKIIQNKNDFCFGIDSVLISDFSKNIKENAIVMDMGAGTGIISLLLCAKTKLKKIFLIEKQKDVADIARRNIELNMLENKMEIFNEDILNLKNIFKGNYFDAIVTNPPYKKANSGLKNESLNKYISRHETTANLEDFIREAKRFLKSKGSLFIVHRPERIVDILSLMRENKIEPKTMQLVYSNIQSEPKLVMIEGVKDAKAFLKVKKPLIIYDENNQYTEDIKKIYNKDKGENNG